MKKNSKMTVGKKQETAKVARKESKRVTITAKLLKGKARILQRKLSAAELTARIRAEAETMEKNPLMFYIGIDLGDRRSRYCFLDAYGELVVEGSLATTAEEFRAYFADIPKSRIAVEVGTHSPWTSSLLEELGHEVHVANPRKMQLIYKNKRKNDRTDAWLLARQVRSDVALLFPIRHRGVKTRQDLATLRIRDAMISARTSLINCARGIVKPIGGRLPSCSAESFHRMDSKKIPEGIRGALLPLLEQIGALTRKIRSYDKEIEKLCEEYPETKILREVRGVGPVTAVAFVLTLEDPDFFPKSRDVGPYLGLVPRQDDSGESSPQLHITKTGDRMLRRLLVQCSQYILGPFGEDCDLRRFGEALSARGGKNAKKRATVAMARKLAVLLHSLWRTGEVYEPLRQAKIKEAAADAAAATATA